MPDPQSKMELGPRTSATPEPDHSVDSLSFGSALSSLAHTFRRRLAESSLAAALPLAAMGFGGPAHAPERPEQGVTAKAIPGRAGQSLRADKVSEEDAKTIVANFDNPLGTLGPIERLLASHYNERNPNRLYSDSSTWLRELSGKEAFSILRQISQDKNNQESERAAALLSDLDAMLTSPVFQHGVATIRATNPGCKAPIGEMSAAWFKSPADIEEFLHVLRSPGFQAYQRTVQTETGVNIQIKLNRVVEEYTAYCTDPSQAVGPGLKPAVARLKQELPELAPADITDLRALFRKVNAHNNNNNNPSPSQDPHKNFEDWLLKLKTTSETLKQHSVETRSLADLPDTVLLENHLSLLRREDVKELNRYLATTYPTLEVGRNWPAKFVEHDDGFLQGVARPILDQLNTDGPTMRRFLALYGKDLGEVNLSKIDFQLLEHNQIPVSDLIENPDFPKFLDQEFAKYSSLQPSLTAEHIFGLSGAFACREEYESLNARLAKRSPSSLPDLSLKDFGSKCALLDTLDQCGFDKIIVNSSDWGIYDFGAAINALESPIARPLYTALTDTWGVKNVDVSDFCQLLQGGVGRIEFFLSPENSQKFAAIRELYPSVSVEAGGQSASLRSLLRLAPDIVRDEQILLRADLAEFLKRYDNAVFQKGPDGKPYVTTYALARIPNDKAPMLANLEKYRAAAQLLEDRYGAAPGTAGRIVERVKDIDRQLETLRSPAVVKQFDSLDGAFLDAIGASASTEQFRASLTPETRLNLAARLSEAPGIESTIRQALAAGASVTTGASLEVLIHECYANAAVRKALSEPSFVKLARVLDQRFFHGTFDTNRFREYEELYTDLKHDPRALQLLLSPQFQQLTSFLGEEFQVATKQASTLRPSLRVAHDLDLHAFKELTKELRAQGEAIASNDVVLLSEVCKNPDLRDRLFNREALLDGLKHVYDRAAFPRKELDQLLDIGEPSEKMSAQRRSDIQKERKAISDAYTERPLLADLSSMQLLRISLIEEMLQREDVQEHLGSLVAKDITTTTTELGGAVVLENGRPSLREHQSSSINNGVFSTYKHNKFMDGIVTFHLHALHIDESNFSGPSGWLGAAGADVAYVNEFNLTDVVFTAMGHPTDAKGKQELHKVRVNADVYFVDKRNPQKPALKIIDLGEVVVPYSPQQ